MRRRASDFLAFFGWPPPQLLPVLLGLRETFVQWFIHVMIYSYKTVIIYSCRIEIIQLCRICIIIHHWFVYLSIYAEARSHVETASDDHHPNFSPSSWVCARHPFNIYWNVHLYHHLFKADLYLIVYLCSWLFVHNLCDYLFMLVARLTRRASDFLAFFWWPPPQLLSILLGLCKTFL